MSWNVQQQTDEGARRRTPYTGRGGLVNGPRPCWGCGSAGRPPRPGPRRVRAGRPAPCGARAAGGSFQWGGGRIGDTPAAPPQFGESCGQGSCPAAGGTWDPPACARRGSELCRQKAGHAARSWHCGSVLLAPTLPVAGLIRDPRCGGGGSQHIPRSGCPASWCQRAAGSSPAGAWSPARAACCLHALAVHG